MQLPRHVTFHQRAHAGRTARVIEEIPPPTAASATTARPAIFRRLVTPTRLAAISGVATIRRPKALVHMPATPRQRLADLRHKCGQDTMAVRDFLYRRLE